MEATVFVKRTAIKPGYTLLLRMAGFQSCRASDSSSFVITAVADIKSIMTRSDCHSKCLNGDQRLRGHCASSPETARLLSWADSLYPSISGYAEVSRAVVSVTTVEICGPPSSFDI